MDINGTYIKTTRFSIFLGNCGSDDLDMHLIKILDLDLDLTFEIILFDTWCSK